MKRIIEDQLNFNYQPSKFVPNDEPCKKSKDVWNTVLDSRDADIFMNIKHPRQKDTVIKEMTGGTV